MTLPFLCATPPGDARGPSSRQSSGPAARWLMVHGSTEEPSSETPDTADAAFITRLRVADEDAFRQLWDRYHERLAHFAMRYLGSRDAAADVVQDVFIALWERHAQIELRGSMTSYLYGMVRYTALDLRKHDRVVQRHVSLTAAAYAAAPTVAQNLGAETLDVEAIQHTLRRVIGSLAPRTREIFLMSREDGLAPAAIAAILGIAPQVVYNQLSRALSALHEAFAAES